MTSLKIDEADIPRLDGKFVIITGEHFTFYLLSSIFSLLSSLSNLLSSISIQSTPQTHKPPSSLTNLSNRLAQRQTTGGSSGIGLATVRILCSNGAKVHILDLYPPSEEDGIPSGATFAKCNVASWTELRQAFDAVRGERIDIAIANAGVSETSDFLDDSFDTAGVLQQPNYEVLDVNLRAVLNFVKLAVRSMRRGDERKIDDDKGMNDSEPGGGGEKKGRKGSIVIISSATAFAPEQSLPVYSATKSAVSSVILFPSSFLTAFHKDPSSFHFLFVLPLVPAPLLSSKRSKEPDSKQNQHFEQLA